MIRNGCSVSWTVSWARPYPALSDSDENQIRLLGMPTDRLGQLRCRGSKLRRPGSRLACVGGGRLRIVLRLQHRADGSPAAGDPAAAVAGCLARACVRAHGAGGDRHRRGADVSDCFRDPDAHRQTHATEQRLAVDQHMGERYGRRQRVGGILRGGHRASPLSREGGAPAIGGAGGGVARAGSPAQSAFPVQQPELHPRAGGGESTAGARHAHSPGQHSALQPAPRPDAHHPVGQRTGGRYGLPGARGRALRRPPARRVRHRFCGRAGGRSTDDLADSCGERAETRHCAAALWRRDPHPRRAPDWRVAAGSGEYRTDRRTQTGGHAGGSGQHARAAAHFVCGRRADRPGQSRRQSRDCHGADSEAGMKALVIDDERLARLELRRLLGAHPEVEITGEARGGEEALALIPKLVPDVIFLDIQMPGMSGFDLLERLEDLPQVIFTTAYDEYALKAFEVNALDYLLKPVAPARLAAALARVRPRTEPARLEQVFVRDGDRCWIVRLPDIFLLESEGNYTRVNFSSERPLIRRSLNALEEQLDPAMFFRAGRKEIVNLQWIQKVDISVAGGLLVTLRGGRTVEMSRRQSSKLREILSL